MAKAKRKIKKIKFKTHQVIAKRVLVTKKGKFLIRSGGQDHFNARESGNTMRGKRRDREVSKTLHENIKRSI